MSRLKAILPLSGIVALAVVLISVFSGASRPRASVQEEEETAEERLSLDQWPPGPAAARGRKVYERYCVGCHGLEGLGDGEAAALLSPKPRNFQKAKFKFRSTLPGQLPMEADLLRTVTCGLPGSSMPSFRLVPEPERRDVVSWVLHLALFGKAVEEVSIIIEDEEISLEEVVKTRLPEIRARLKKEHLEGRVVVSVPPPPPKTPKLLAHARERFQRECAKCHGPTGRGEGNSAYALRDWKDAEIVPRDFTTGVFRSGSSPRDLYLRLKTGLNGTPMPAMSGTPEELWGFVYLILDMKDPKRKVKGNRACGAPEEGR